MARTETVGNIQGTDETIGSGKSSFSQVEDHSELPCKRQQVPRSDKDTSLMVDADIQPCQKL